MAKKWDAVLVPDGYPKHKTGEARRLALRGEFVKDLGGSRVHVTHTAGGSILTADAVGPDGRGVAHRYDPDTGSDRFDWLDRGDGVLLGLLKPAPAPEDEDTPAAAGAAKSKALERTAARYDELAAVGGRTPDEEAEFARLGRFLAVMDPGRGVKAPRPGPAAGAVPGPRPDAPDALTTPKPGGSGDAPA